MSNVQQMQDLYEAFGRGEIPVVLGAMDPGIEWRQAEGHPFQPSGMPFLGPDAILQNVFSRLGTEWDGFTVTPKEFHDAGPVVVVEARYTGTHKETGKSLDAQVCHMWKISDGKITSFQQYTDTGQWQDAVDAG